MELMISSICKRIEAANDWELSEIALAVLARYRDLFPEEETIFISLPLHDQQERARLWQLMTEQTLYP